MKIVLTEFSLKFPKRKIERDITPPIECPINITDVGFYLIILLLNNLI